jgi:hypothetical protein
VPRRGIPFDTATGLQDGSDVHMSIIDSLSMPRLYFYRGHGVAQYAFDKPAIELKVPPDLGFAFVEIDYERGICAQLRATAHDQIRDMTQAESDACLAYLKALA